MNYLSVCSGIEAATVAWHPLGWNPVAFSEIESFPSQVLKHHYPEVPNLGDMTKFKEWQIESNVDVLVGGTPCQSFSVAGLRKGLDDPRGNLMLTYLAIAEELRGLAVEFNLPIVSATQTTRSGFSNTDVELTDTSESFGLPATADFMFALISTEELEGLNQIMVKQLKNRYNDPTLYKRFMIGIDRAKMRLYDLEDIAQSNCNQICAIFG